ncbi:hypothetical protein HLB44_25190 [Aquincola sp. S2]|uniref:Uncharacterized protein n=1 Tax=Pseudaquabacterium terrae TaxID=2732868 RepID=A0ABX2ENP3_9BURK|nr:hypothetical protein [Aquabacterium terrae]NRF70309.1 hypothetical protein [Aquabacterium terrae]
MRLIAFAFAAATAAGGLASGHAVAQYQPQPRILYSAPLMGSNSYTCSVANVSANPVTISQFRFDTLDGPITQPTTCNVGMSTTLDPGEHCSTTLPLNGPFAGLFTVACRIRHTGGENAVQGSLQGFGTQPSGAPSLMGVSRLQSVGFTAAP